ncbi:MAG: iron-containing alcohol dehydrogenase [Akkermansiaceae bacterium]|jgi:alcohol dehydrogenase class IV|nr:iron-containing alcohol dehydrogenase [Akkermansiaceae bacterium]
MAGKFEFATPGRVVFGWGTFPEAGAAAMACGRPVLLVTSGHSVRAAALDDRLAASVPGWSAIHLAVTGEPDTDTVATGCRLAREARCAAVLAVGGGSVIDAGKAIAALVPNSRPLIDYLEVIGAAMPLEQPPLPCIAVPTTAGTGAEATRNAVLRSPEHQVKVSLRSPLMLPRLAVVDPELTATLPPAITAATGMDALTQLIEPFVSSRANPFTDALCREGIRLVARSLERACQAPDRPAREDLALAACFSGMALANAGLGAVHGFAAPIGGMFAAPHGAVCAALLAPVMEANIAALTACAPASPGLRRYAEIAALLTGRPAARPQDGAQHIRGLAARLAVKPLAAFGVGPAHLPDLVHRARAASSMQTNPVALPDETLTAILRQAL